MFVQTDESMWMRKFTYTIYMVRVMSGMQKLLSVQASYNAFILLIQMID